jgi:hypothetical protein
MEYAGPAEGSGGGEEAVDTAAVDKSRTFTYRLFTYRLLPTASLLTAALPQLPPKRTPTLMGMNRVFEPSVNML